MSDLFDFMSFHRAVVATVAARGVSWKAVSKETGVSQSTLSRMGAGRQPGGASLTAIAAWSGLNPVDFYGSKPRDAEPLAMVGILLRCDPRLDAEGGPAGPCPAGFSGARRPW